VNETESLLHHVDVYAVMPDGMRRLSFTGSVKTLIERHWLDVKPKPKEDVLTFALLQHEEISLPMIFPVREQRPGWDSNDPHRALFRPIPLRYVACGRTYEGES
jgi:hypothetical protein